MKKFNVSVVIPNLNGEKLLQKNLPSLLKALDNPENCITEIIVVDDASTDGSLNLISTKFPQIKIIKHKITRGFSAAVNTGARASKGNLLVLLNTDVAPTSDFLVSVFKHFDNKNVFAVSLHEKGFGSAKARFSAGYIQLSMADETLESHPSFYVSGGSGVFRRDIWMLLGGMDEKLLSPFYWEDIDLCYRAAKRGYINLWDPDGHVIHDHESTINKLSKNQVERIRERNQLLVIWKNILSSVLIQRHIIGVLRRILRHPGYVRIVFMALGRLGIVLKARSREKREAKISDEIIFSRF